MLLVVVMMSWANEYTYFLMEKLYIILCYDLFKRKKSTQVFFLF